MIFKPVSLMLLLTPVMVLSAAVEQENGEADAQPKPFFKGLFRGVETPKSSVRGGLLQPRKLDGMGNADVLYGQVCMNEAGGKNYGCTAEDVKVAEATNIEILDDGCTSAGDTVKFKANFKVVLTAQERHDIGIWFSEDGDPNGDKARTGMCTVATPPYAPDPPNLDLDGTNDPLPGDNKASGEQDTCGDIDSAHNPLEPMITLTVTCIDTDGDGFLDIPYCTSWRQPGANDLCTSPLDAFPGAPSKCKCDDLPVPIPVPCFPEECADQCNDGDCSTGTCVPVPKAKSTPCEDGLYCTSFGGAPGDADHCDGEGTCVGDPVDCDDGDSCTTDSCNEDTDQCDYVTRQGYYLKCATDLYLCGILESEIEKVGNSYDVGGCNTGRVRNVFVLDPATCLDDTIDDPSNFICDNGQALSNYGFATCEGNAWTVSECEVV